MSNRHGVHSKLIQYCLTTIFEKLKIIKKRKNAPASEWESGQGNGRIL